MQGRTFIWGTPGSILAIGLAVSGCMTTGTTDACGHQVDKRHTIDAGVDSTLARLYTTANGSRELLMACVTLEGTKVTRLKTQ
ncbi:hypothetical protein [Paraburkholderia lacunae]|uniref:hypothetical protein n=1 Tax=Paraburkholderia lacunae TaxID=2211104 RepID=UPI001FCB22F4|nr:hypothetical protein [Paraburkholderia lacunae]